MLRTEKRGKFPCGLARFKIGGLNFEALGGVGGHMHGEVLCLAQKKEYTFLKMPLSISEA